MSPVGDTKRSEAESRWREDRQGGKRDTVERGDENPVRIKRGRAYATIETKLPGEHGEKIVLHFRFLFILSTFGELTLRCQTTPEWKWNSRSYNRREINLRC